MLYFSVAKSKKDFKTLKFHSWESGPIIENERNDVVHNFFTSIDVYVRYYEKKKPQQLTEIEESAIEEIVGLFGNYTLYELLELTRKDVFAIYNNKEREETPWKKSRNKNDRERSKEVISIKKIRSYYPNSWFEVIKNNEEHVRKILIER